MGNPSSEQGFLNRNKLQSLIVALKNSGYDCFGPQIKNAAIVYDHIENIEELPNQVLDEQTVGVYRLKKSPQAGMFSWANGPQAIKPFVLSPREELWKVEKQLDDELIFDTVETSQRPIAIIGVKACDLQALKLMDQHFLNGEHIDEHYYKRRKNLFLVSVNCRSASAMCFCNQTGDGPTVIDGCDLILTELDDGFIVASDSKIGTAVLHKLSLDNIQDTHRIQAEKQRKSILDALEAAPLKLDYTAMNLDLDLTRWKDVATRCLSCGNCTMVCPTCFCHSQVEESDLSGNFSMHVRQWDSCFSHNHSYIHGIVIRADTAARYRQWLTHKFKYWIVQYGRSGCVGCGRCRTWCPAGIDIIEELSRISNY